MACLMARVLVYITSRQNGVYDYLAGLNGKQNSQLADPDFALASSVY
jgi:hypothetical protein